MLEIWLAGAVDSPSMHEAKVGDVMMRWQRLTIKDTVWLLEKVEQDNSLPGDKFYTYYCTHAHFVFCL